MKSILKIAIIAAVVMILLAQAAKNVDFVNKLIPFQPTV